MPDFDYDRWWTLHLRIAKGEMLSEQEQSDYRLGLNHLDGSLELPNDDTLTYLRTLRAAINRAAALHDELAARSAELDEKIARLETSYQQVTGHKLNLTPHASA